MIERDRIYFGYCTLFAAYIVSIIVIFGFSLWAVFLGHIVSGSYPSLGRVVPSALTLFMSYHAFGAFDTVEPLKRSSWIFKIFLATVPAALCLGMQRYSSNFDGFFTNVLFWYATIPFALYQYNLWAINVVSVGAQTANTEE